MEGWVIAVIVLASVAVVVLLALAAVAFRNAMNARKGERVQLEAAIDGAFRGKQADVLKRMVQSIFKMERDDGTFLFPILI